MIYLDQRGNGRSDREPRDAWTLAQWGGDVFEFCRTLEIERPIVFGVSFGGFVALSYATRHPEHAGKLILCSTFARARAFVDRSIELYEKFGGAELGDLARRFLLDGVADQELYAEWNGKSRAHYSRRAKSDPEAAAREIRTAKPGLHFGGPGGEGHTFDMRGDLAKISCPALVIGGEEDPQTPIEGQEEIAAGIRPDLVRFARIADAGHGPYRDEPETVFAIMREFILAKDD